ncbi:hypothetical protein [Xylella taiwanensis]|nr:hypothetical protein [Xylella taiwanensis]MCD8464216.1 hypothetical protein [Xylella taiwanensis]MCD8466671.1 hypothetical protein [Xylella taiwanensis]UFN02406.1 hypothetical protein LPH43_00545 [Xylella taiwanensis]UFN09168.1 hypothetical protein LPH45_00335 [Xylella taiwanensis]UFN10451.1 hypothetical protein LPH44_06710 [Xylella taiwanensis]
MSMHGMHGCSHLSVVLPGVVLAPLLLQGTDSPDSIPLARACAPLVPLLCPPMAG